MHSLMDDTGPFKTNSYNLNRSSSSSCSSPNINSSPVVDNNNSSTTASSRFFDINCRCNMMFGRYVRFMGTGAAVLSVIMNVFTLRQVVLDSQAHQQILATLSTVSPTTSAVSNPNITNIVTAVPRNDTSVVATMEAPLRTSNSPAVIGYNQSWTLEHVASQLEELRTHDKNKETFSACLLIMDENHRLSEWLAYHYHVLPLRHLVVAVDPRSRTSPTPILNRWRKFMTIEEWSDKNFTFDRDYRKLNESDTLAKTIHHRLRQATFYKDCSLHLKKIGRTWTTYHDIDEFISIDEDFYADSETRMRQPGSILTLLEEIRSTQPKNEHYQKPCITIPRTLFGTLESTPEQIHKGVPEFLNPVRFETLRYRHRVEHGKIFNGPVKSIFDVRHAPMKNMYSVHVLVGNGLCGSKDVKHAPFNIHHYLGSWEYYSSKDDARRGKDRTYDRWLERSRRGKHRNDDELRPWIQGFVEYVGNDMAKFLLHDVGKLQVDNTTSSLWATI